MKFRLWLRDEVYKIPQKERGIAPVFGSRRHPSQIPYSESRNSSRINRESNLDVRFRFGGFSLGKSGLVFPSAHGVDGGSRKNRIARNDRQPPLTVMSISSPPLSNRAKLNGAEDTSTTQFKGEERPFKPTRYTDGKHRVTPVSSFRPWRARLLRESDARGSGLGRTGCRPKVERRGRS